MRQITVDIDPRDYMDECDWKEVRAEALKQLLGDSCPVDAGIMGDLADARRAILRHRPGEALVLLDRALEAIARNE